MMEIFEAGRVYDDSDKELDLIATKNKRAAWRHQRTGPSFLKFGRRVKYLGSDLNDWIANHRHVSDQTGR